MIAIAPLSLLLILNAFLWSYRATIVFVWWMSCFLWSKISSWGDKHLTNIFSLLSKHLLEISTSQTTSHCYQSLYYFYSLLGDVSSAKTRDVSGRFISPNHPFNINQNSGNQIYLLVRYRNFCHLFPYVQRNYIIVTFPGELACSRKLKQDQQKPSNVRSRNDETYIVSHRLYICTACRVMKPAISPGKGKSQTFLSRISNINLFITTYSKNTISEGTWSRLIGFWNLKRSKTHILLAKNSLLRHCDKCTL